MSTSPTILEKSGYNRDRKLKVVGTSPVKHDGIDKVTGRAKFGADLFLPGMLVGKILRSPHPHARIKSIDVAAAEAACRSVKAVVTRDDFPETKPGTPGGDMSRNAMAREKALYDGHPVAAVAAVSESIAKQALEADQGRIRGAAARESIRSLPCSRAPRSCTSMCARKGNRRAPISSSNVMIERLDLAHGGRGGGICCRRI